MSSESEEGEEESDWLNIPGDESQGSVCLHV